MTAPFNDYLSIVGEKFFNDYLRIDTKRFPISVKWNLYMYILQQIEWINFWTVSVEDTRLQTLQVDRILFIVHNFPLRPWKLTILMIA
jgi:hypothetical protein